MRRLTLVVFLFLLSGVCLVQAADWAKPYAAPCTERENVFALTEKPAVKYLGNDKYEITFAVKGYCDVTVELVDKDDGIVRHLASGVLGVNAPKPFQKNSKKQTHFNGFMKMRTNTASTCLFQGKMCGV